MKIVNALTAPPKLRRRLRRLYKQAFPANERKPWRLLLQLARAGKSELLAALNEQGQFCGLAVGHFWRDIVLLDYFATEEALRNQGLGSRFLQLLQERYSGRRLLLEIERPGSPGCNEALCRRRREFYHRCGLLETGHCAHVFATELLLLWQPLGDTANPAAPSFADYVELYRQLFGGQIIHLLNIHEVDIAGQRGHKA